MAKTPETDAPAATRAAVLAAIELGVRKVKGDAAAADPIGEATGLWASEEPGQRCLYFDSLDLLELVVFLEDAYGWEIPEDRLDPQGWRTVGDLAAALTEIALSTGAKG